MSKPKLSEVSLQAWVYMLILTLGNKAFVNMAKNVTAGKHEDWICTFMPWQIGFQKI